MIFGDRLLVRLCTYSVSIASKLNHLDLLLELDYKKTFNKTKTPKQSKTNLLLKSQISEEERSWR